MQNTHDLLVGTLSIGIPSSKFQIDISVRFSIHSTTLPVIFLLPSSHVYKPFAGPKSFWRRLEYGC